MHLSFSHLLDKLCFLQFLHTVGCLSIAILPINLKISSSWLAVRRHNSILAEFNFCCFFWSGNCIIFKRSTDSMVEYDIPFVNGFCVVGGVSSSVNDGNSFLLLLLISLGLVGPDQLKKVSYMIYV